MHLSRLQKGIVYGVTLAGIGVMTTAALAEELGVRKKEEQGEKQEQETDALEVLLELPSIPASKEECVRMWASGYEKLKKPLSDVFRITGQMLVAPIAMLVIDASYAKYLEYVDSQCGAGKIFG